MSKLTRFGEGCKQNRAPPSKIIADKKIIFLEEKNVRELFRRDS